MHSPSGGVALVDSGAKLPPPPRRFSEPRKFVPVAYFACTFCFLYGNYVFGHCVPLLQLGQDKDQVDENARARGQLELVVFHIITAMLLFCYLRSMFVHPGAIPQDDPEWNYQQGEYTTDPAPSFVKETKRSGLRRHCKWCGKYKPDRCHHCRVCQSCVLRMDHHCPWIYNCVGFFNYKYFLLLLFYCMLDCHLIMWTMTESVIRCVDQRMGSVSIFNIIFAETLAGFLGVLVTLFFGFHIWLTAGQGVTTIEFCEKSMPKDDKRPQDTTRFNLGIIGNLRGVMGDNVFLWLLPIGGPSGDGLSFATVQPAEETWADDLEATRVFSRDKPAAPRRKFGQWAFCSFSDSP